MRWTPEFTYLDMTTPARFTIANVTVWEELRGRGIFTRLITALCATTVPVIGLECIQNPRLAEWAIGVQFPNRETRVSGHGVPTVNWVV